ncbi:MAG: hypothetical protein ACYDBQ_11110 [Thermoplasmatota archaeon]
MDVSSWAGLALPLLTGAGLVAIAALVARTGWEHVHNRLFSALYLLSGVKSWTDGLRAAAQGQSWAERFHAASPLFPGSEFWGSLGALCLIAELPLLLLFASHFPRAAPWVARHPGRVVALAIAAAVLAAAYLRPPPLALGFLAGRGVVIVALGLVATAVTISVVAILARTLARTRNPIERSQAGYVLAGWTPSFAVTWLFTGLTLKFLVDRNLSTLAWENPIQEYVSPVLELVAAAFVAYAILKFRLLGIELQVKGGVKYIVMTATVGGILFLVVTYVENFVLQAQFFSFAGPQVAAVLSGITSLLLFRPVERIAEIITNRLFPGTAGERAAYNAHRSADIYLAQVTQALSDGKLSDREWRMLHRLRDELKLTGEEAVVLEERAERMAGVDVAGLGRA